MSELDPEGINFGCNKDEYRPEAQELANLLPYATDADDARRIVDEVWARWFTAG